MEEVAIRLGHMGLPKERAAYVHKCLQPIKQLLCNMIGRLIEQPLVHELAYAVDYAVRQDGEVDPPVIDLLFPHNYKDFHYNEGIAKDIQRIDMFF